MRSAIRLLRRENTLLKAEGLLGDFHSLPKLPHADPVTPELRPTQPFGSPSSDTDDILKTPPAPGENGARFLWREMAKMQASAQIIDLRKAKGEKGWQPLRKIPEVQFYESQKARAKFLRDVRNHLEALP